MKRRIEPAPHADTTKGTHATDTSPGHHGPSLVDVGFRERVHSSAEPL